jgi:protein-L-isoaspartate(D-aspartate) O-methyltransferase
MLFLVALLAVHAFASRPGRAQDFEGPRKRMVTRQLKGRDIVDSRVLKAMQEVPRHRFVPDALQHLAYADTPLPIGHDQTISQPYIVALMSQVLAVRPGQRVLEIGTGSGYQAAVLAAMGARVYSIEIVPELGKRAIDILGRLGYDARIKIGDGYQGWPDQAPFDAIIVTCAPTRVPEPLKAQLADGGRMVIPVGPTYDQRLILLTKSQGEIRQQKVVNVRFVPMVDERGKTY